MDVMRTGRRAAAILLALAVTGCADGPFGAGAPAVSRAEIAIDTSAPTTAPAMPPPLAAGLALWDGRPSLGGVWVAAAGAEADGPVLIRDRATGREAVGRLYGREGVAPPLRLSSRAAAALGLEGGRLAQIVVRPAPGGAHHAPGAEPARAMTVARRNAAAPAPRPRSAAPATPVVAAAASRIAIADSGAVRLVPVAEAPGVYRIAARSPISARDPAPHPRAAPDPRREGPQ